MTLNGEILTRLAILESDTILIRHTITNDGEKYLKGNIWILETDINELKKLAEQVKE